MKVDRRSLLVGFGGALTAKSVAARSETPGANKYSALDDPTKVFGRAADADDALPAFGQNGEELRPEQGFPLRLSITTTQYILMERLSMFIYRVNKILVPLVVVLISSCSKSTSFAYPDNYELGSPVSNDRLQLLQTAIPPDGEGLPFGEGTFNTGRQIYEMKCVSCHGRDLAGTSAGKPLIGGRGTLASDDPFPTVESYWPYAPSVFSYIRNTMPTTAPGTLSDPEVYALLAYVLGSANIIPLDFVLNKDTLPEVLMPNRDGFVRDPRPDVSNVL